MSGIAGFLRFDRGEFDPGLARSMLDRMAHRGPDGASVWRGEGVELAQCMMCTTPESLEEVQPLVSPETDAVLVMDGRVDNWEELRAKLLGAGARLRTHADAELVLAGYDIWGRSCLDHIDGDFALAIWDARRKELFCARDRLGARPFFYNWDGCRFSFASELHAILHLPWVPKRLNEAMIAERLGTEERSLTDTVWDGIQRLDAAHGAVVDQNGPRTSQYWSPQLKPEIHYRRLDDYAEHYREIFTESVRRQSRSQTGLACEVSGGLDSSAVFAVADHLDRTGSLLAPSVEGYSLNFGDGSQADEIHFARMVAEHVGRVIHEIPPSLMTVEWYADLVSRFCEFPHYPNTAMSQGIHEAARSDGRRVILTGYGGDEWQMGSRYYYNDLLRRADLKGMFSAFRDEKKAFGARTALYGVIRFGLAPTLPRGVFERIKRARRRFAGVPRMNGFRLSDRLLAELPHQSARGAFLPPNAAPRHEESFRMLQSPQRRDARESFNLLASTGEIEKRDPMTSTSMVEFHFRTPDIIRQRADEFRICHRTAMRDYLPDAVLNRGSKADFSSTIFALKDEICSSRLDSLEECAKRWLNPEEIQRIRDMARAQTLDPMEIWAFWALFGCSLLLDQLGDTRVK